MWPTGPLTQLKDMPILARTLTAGWTINCQNQCETHQNYRTRLPACQQAAESFLSIYFLTSATSVKMIG